MSKDIPTSAVGPKAGSKAKAVGSVQAHLEEFGYLEGEGPGFEQNEVFVRRNSDDHVLDAPLSATPGVLWHGGDKALPTTAPPDETVELICDLLRCFPGEKGVADELCGRLDTAGVDVNHLLRCIELICRRRSPTQGTAAGDATTLTTAQFEGLVGGHSEPWSRAHREALSTSSRVTRPLPSTWREKQ